MVSIREKNFDKKINAPYEKD